MEDSNQWLELAERDIKAAEKIKDVEEYEASAFLCHQAAEKALKAVYIKKFGKLLKTHDLVLLATETEAEELKNICKELTPAYLYTRYPDVEKVEGIEKLIEGYLAHAKQVVEWAKKNL